MRTLSVNVIIQLHSKQIVSVFLCVILTVVTAIGTNRVFIDKFAVIVNDEVILESDVIIEQKLYDSTIISDEPHSDLLTRESALDRLIRRFLLQKEASNYNELKITNSEVENYLQEIENRVGGKEKLNVLLDDYLLSCDELKVRIANHLLIESYIEHRIRSFIPIHRKAVEEFIKTNPLEFGINGAVTDTQLNSILENKVLFNLLSVYLREKAVSEQLEKLLNKMVMKAEIVYPDTLPVMMPELSISGDFVPMPEKDVQTGEK